MPRIAFISYAPSDGRNFAYWLAEELRVNSDAEPWLDEIKVTSCESPAEAVAEAIQTCTCLLFILTNDSAATSSRCKGEWQRAVQYKKPIVVLDISANAVPYRLETRTRIDFVANRNTGLARLLEWIGRAATPNGELEHLQEQYKDCERELEYATEALRPRVLSDIEVLKQQIQRLKEALTDPEGVNTRVDERISLALESERHPKSPKPKEPQVLRFINQAPSIVPRYFQNRFVETEIIAKFLRDPGAKLITIIGRGGIGKTALVCRVLKALENGKLPDNMGEFALAGIIYLAETGTRRINFSNMYNDLTLLVPPDERNELIKLGENPQATVIVKIKALIAKLPAKPVVVLLDNFEDLIDPKSLSIVDHELRSAIETICALLDHPIKLIITTRSPSRDLAEISPVVGMTISLDQGLETPYAETVLKEMDADGALGLKTGPQELLGKIREFTRGFPRALEAFFAILSADRDTSIADLLSSKTPPDRIIKVLVGEAYSRLASEDQLIMQALAVYGHPVNVGALDYLLKPWIPHIDCSLSLKRLVSSFFVRKEDRAYFLHPVDKEHALKRLKAGLNPPTPDATERPFVLTELKSRAADYYEEISCPRSEWKTLDDIVSYVNQFELRLEAGSEVSAADILKTITGFLERRGAFQQQLTLAQSLEQHSQLFSYPREVALRVQALASWRIGRMKEAARIQQKLIEVLKFFGNESKIRTAKINRTIYDGENTSYDEQLQAFQEYLDYIEKYQPWNLADHETVNMWIGNCLQNLGHLEKSLSYRNKALELATDIGEVDGIEAETHNLGNSEKAMGNIEKAKTLYSKALALAEESQNPLWKANHIQALSECIALDGNIDQAINYLREAISIRKEIGDLEREASNTQDLARYLISAGDLKAARSLCDTAIQIAEDLGVNMTSYYCLAARVRLLSGEISAARLFIERARALPQIGSTWNLDNLFGSILLRTGIGSDAEKAFGSALAQCDEWLKRSALNWEAHEARGLALAGMVACGVKQQVDESVKSYNAARERVSAPGAIAYRLRDFEALGMNADDPNVIAIRSAISGKLNQKDRTETTPVQSHVFFSYSREDSVWLERLLLTLAPLIQNKTVQVWHDEKIEAGTKWRKEIADALQKARLGVLLVSPAFLASEFIKDHELPYLIEKAEQNKVRLIWILLKHCLYEETAIAEIGAAHDPSKAINEYSDSEIDLIMKTMAKKIKDLYDS